MAKRVAIDWIDLKIDIDRMTHGKEVQHELRGTERGGIPWLVILDAQGKKLITSDGPKGNVGCPVEPHEIEHFMAMLRQTRQRASDGDLAKIEQELLEYGKPHRRAERR